MPEASPGARGERRALAVVALLSLGAVAPLLLGTLPATHDGLHHLFRLLELDRGLRAWHLYPRLFSEMGFGYGYPVLNFYSPLSYYLSWIGTAVGLGYIGGIKAAYVVGVAAAALAAYAWGRTFLPRPAAALLALAYTYVPYRTADMLVRGALAEATAFVWPPLILWLAAAHHRRPRPGYPAALALATAGFVLTHNLTAFMFAPLLLLYVAALYDPPHRAARQYLGLGGAAAAGVLLAAFYWLPATLEVRYVLAGQVSGLAGLSELLQPPLEWLSPYLPHRYTPLQGVAAQHPFGLVQAAATVAAAALALAAWRRASRPGRGAVAVSLAATAGLLFLLTPASTPLWEHLPGLNYLQFPWRLQAPLALTTATLIGCGAAALPRRGRWPATLALTAALAATAMLGLRLEPARLPTGEPPLLDRQVNLDGLLDYDFQTALWLRDYGGDWLLEYLPIWALAERQTFFLPEAVPSDLPPLPPGSRLQVLADAPLRTDLRLSLPEPATLVLHRFYFPGWQARLDGRRLPGRPVGSMGLLGFDLPAGDYDLRVALGTTPPRLAGGLLSLSAAAALAGWALRHRHYYGLAASVAVAAALLALVAVRAAAYPTTYRPLPLQAQVGDSVRLVGYTTERRGAEVDVRLYWWALRPPEHDYRAFVHAVDDTGQALAQHDGRPGNEFSPTTRWLPGELVCDRHTLGVAQAPHTLFAGLYTWPEVANLPVTLDDGTAGHSVRLGEAGTP